MATMMASTRSALRFASLLCLAAVTPATAQRRACFPVPHDVGGYGYVGCYTDQGDQHTLTGSVLDRSDLTQEMCASLCDAYEYFGVESGTQCYCGTQFLSTATKRPETECSQRCGGSSSEVCGASDRINIFKSLSATETSSTTPPATSTASSSSSTTSSESSTSESSTSESSTSESSTSESSTSESSTPSATSTTSDSSIAPTVPSTADITIPSTSFTSPDTTSAPTSTTQCALTTVYAGTPSPCFASVPTACLSLSSLVGQAAIVPASRCSSAFFMRTTVAPEVASCFSNLSRPQSFTATSAYACVTSAPIFCQFNTFCADSPQATATSGSPAPTNPVSNANFETGDMSGWIPAGSSDPSVMSAAVSSDISHNGGTYSLKSVFTNSNGGSFQWYQDVSLEPGANYVASWWWYSTNSAASTVSRMQFTGAATFVKDASTTGGPVGQWVQVTQSFTAASNFGRVRITVYGNRQAAANTFYVDDFALTRV